MVNNAGYALVGALEETSTDEIRAQFETNFFGAVRVMQTVIPIMRKQQQEQSKNHYFCENCGSQISENL